MKYRPSRSRSLCALLFCAALATGACGGASEDPINVSVAVDASVTHQTLEGFGAATAYQAYLLAGRTDDIFQALFVDSGLDILRLGNWYQNKGQADTTTAFDDDDAVQIVQKATAARGGTPPKILMSSWTPPAYLKSNGVTRPPFGSGSSVPAGTLIQNGGAYAYADFGDWWARSLQAYAAVGVVPDWVSIQNEPDFSTSQWETCVFGPTEGATVAGIAAAGYGQALDAVSGAIQAAAFTSPPVLLGPETTGFEGNIVQQYLNGLDPSKLGGIAHHLYGNPGDNPAPDTFNASLGDLASSGEAEALPTFMTEYSPDAPTMFDTAWLINNALTIENASAYIYWELVWNNSMPPTGLVTIASSSPGAYTINDLYYALKHFARWTDPGWVRVDAISSVPAVRTSAFVSPDGASLTLVLLNTSGSQDHLVSISPGAFPFGTVTIYRSAGDSERTTVVAPEGDGSIALPARAIATVTYTP